MEGSFCEEVLNLSLDRPLDDDDDDDGGIVWRYNVGSINTKSLKSSHEVPEMFYQF